MQLRLPNIANILRDRGLGHDRHDEGHDDGDVVGDGNNNADDDGEINDGIATLSALTSPTAAITNISPKPSSKLQ